MTFRKEKGRHEAVTSDGKIIHFEDAAEMKACAELRDSLLVLVGREPENVGMYATADEQCSPLQTNKNVRICIDTEAEFITSSTAEAVPLPQQGRLIEKAFA